eukprot:gene9143-18945_t
MRIDQLHMLFAYINTNGNGTVGEQKLRIVGNKLLRERNDGMPKNAYPTNNLSHITSNK